VTGLIWQRDLPRSYDGCTGVTKSPNDTCRALEAKQYCDRLKLQGASWRLPSKIELESLLDHRDYGRETPFIDQDAFPNTPSDDFWTGSPFADPQLRNVWRVSFGVGYSVVESDTVALKVRCVRSVVTRPGVPSDRYTIDDVNDTITDTRTQLTWQRTVDSNEIAWADASSYCSARGAGFRVPTAKELLTQLDPTRYPAIEPIFESPRGNWVYWASTPDRIKRTQLIVDPATGFAINESFGKSQSREYSHHVRCVR